jgi:hypothetical protein
LMVILVGVFGCSGSLVVGKNWDWWLSILFNFSCENRCNKGKKGVKTRA